MSRTAEEWGRVAVSLPGWRWMPGMLASHGGWNGRTVRRKRTRGVRLAGGGDVGHGCWPDPDDLATAGCLLALLGSGVRVWMDVDDGLWTVEVGGVRASMHATLGRACIAAAEALGRWPGGGA